MTIAPDVLLPKALAGRGPLEGCCREEGEKYFAGVSLAYMLHITSVGLIYDSAGHLCKKKKRKEEIGPTRLRARENKLPLAIVFMATARHVAILLTRSAL